MSALNDANLGRVAASIAKPAYDRSAARIGVVHFGPGAFHRAHQAAYFDDLLSRDPRWAICDVALRSKDGVDALKSQNGLYTLAILDEKSGHRIIGSVKEAVHAPSEQRALMARLASPDVRVVTLTITEKGYCLDAKGALDASHADIAHDIANPAAPKSAIGWLVAGLKARRAAKLAPFCALSCDNLSGNGVKLRAAVIALAEASDPNLAKWIAGEARFPSTMVDSITPASDAKLLASIKAAIGLADAAPVQREAFTAWVIENDLPERFPDLASVGAVVTPDVAGFERAKLRMLNGAHSTMAYLGLARGRATVGEAMADKELSVLVDEMMQGEIAPSIKAPPGLDLDEYRRALLKRFRNPAITHKLSQIAWDGSQKLPIRLFGTIADNLVAGRPIDKLTTGVAAWMRFLARAARTGAEITDPTAADLKKAGADASDNAQRDTEMFLERTQIAPANVAANAVFRTALTRAYGEVMRHEAAAQ